MMMKGMGEKKRERGKEGRERKGRETFETMSDWFFLYFDSNM